MLKIALLGYGKLGRLIEDLAQGQGHSIIACINSHTPKEKKQEQISLADVCIDFSVPSVAIEHIKMAAEAKKPIVVGTTGWYEKIDQVEDCIRTHGTACIYGNFSLGMILFQQIIQSAARLMKYFEQYDIAGHEIHHRHKVDAPSGTAVILEDILKKETGRKSIPFSSTRCGSIPGTHTIFLDSPCDTIELTHHARNRSGFAEGALIAAKWIIGKQGIFTFQELVESHGNVQ
ncbi:MAG: 4-hydroxy-tetrahydrodipicolinate reductase [Parachlamydiales bacterium]|jgi:4-hydroxy-tetrahydrodipicolinate reductase